MFRKCLLVFIIALLFTPLLEQYTNIIHLHPLKGVTLPTTKNDPGLSFSSWFSADYQNYKEEVLSDSCGFRSIFIRINNQIDYSLFNQTHAQNVILGKDGYFFANVYIYGHYGTDFIGRTEIDQITDKLAFIRDTLAKLGKTLILVVTPNKADFYSQFIPDENVAKQGPTNYGTYMEFVKKKRLNCIDFNQFFLDNKNRAKYPLYSQHGTHWSMYGAALAGDSLIKYIEKVKNIQMPHAIWKDIEIADPKDFDIDIEEFLNLVFDLKSWKMAYPKIEFPKNTPLTKPNVLVVGDSYYWGLVSGYDIYNAFSPTSNFWYYNNSVYPESSAKKTVVGDLNLKEQIAKHDVIIILATAHNYGTLGWGFINNTYNMFKGAASTQLDTTYKRKLTDMRNRIKDDADWFKQVTEKAQKKGVPVDSMLTLDAIWVIEQQKK
jgi:hypothetical protein